MILSELNMIFKIDYENSIVFWNNSEIAEPVLCGSTSISLHISLQCLHGVESCSFNIFLV